MYIKTTIIIYVTITSRCEKEEEKKTRKGNNIKQHRIHVVGNRIDKNKDKNQNIFSTGNHFL